MWGWVGVWACGRVDEIGGWMGWWVGMCLCASHSTPACPSKTLFTRCWHAFSSPHARVAKGHDSNLFGVLLMCGYLVADGYTSTCQQAM